MRNANDICFEQVETNEVEICLSTNHVRAGFTTARATEKALRKPTTNWRIQQNRWRGKGSELGELK